MLAKIICLPTELNNTTYEAFLSKIKPNVLGVERAARLKNGSLCRTHPNSNVGLLLPGGRILRPSVTLCPIHEKKKIKPNQIKPLDLTFTLQEVQGTEKILFKITTRK